MQNNKLTGREFHQRLNPQHPIPDLIAEIIGIDDAMVAGMPVFAEVAQELIDFIGTTKIVTHGADFEKSFLAQEFSIMEMEWPHLNNPDAWIDTLAIFKEKHPGEQCSLDALCEMYGVQSPENHPTASSTLESTRMLAEIWLKAITPQTSNG